MRDYRLGLVGIMAKQVDKIKFEEFTIKGTSITIDVDFTLEANENDLSLSLLN